MKIANGITIAMMLAGGAYVGDHYISSVEVHEQQYQEVLSQRTYQQVLPQDEMHNWNNLILRRPNYKVDVAKYTPDPEWQKFRVTLHGLSDTKRYLALERWLSEHNYDHASQVQVTNYVNALKRGGMVEVE